MAIDFFWFELLEISVVNTKKKYIKLHIKTIDRQGTGLAAAFFAHWLHCRS